MQSIYKRPVRCLSTSAAPAQFSGFLDRIALWRRKKPASRDPTESAPDKREIPDGTVVELPVIGKPPSKGEEWSRVREFAEFKAWPTNHYRRDLSKNQIDAALAGFANQPFQTPDQRFKIVKQIEQVLAISVPDPALSKFTSLQDLKEHLLQHARKFDEKQPDAVYLNQSDFLGTNIRISDPVSERKDQRRRRAKLLEEARAAQLAQEEKLLQ